MGKALYLNNFECQFIDAVKDVASTGTPATELNYGILRLNNTASGVLTNPTGGDYYLLTAFKRSGGAESAWEVLKVTAVDIATYPGECRITVLRAQEGTTAKAYVTNDFVQLRWTKGAAEGLIQQAEKDATGGIPGLTLFKLNLRNAANTVTSWLTTAATVARTWTMPDKDGTVAMTSDVPVAASTTPAALGTAAVGSGTTYARADHVHQLITSVSGSSGSCTGNAATATSAVSLASTNWTVIEVTGVLYFRYGGVNKFSMDSSGNFKALANVSAYTTP